MINSYVWWTNTKQIMCNAPNVVSSVVKSITFVKLSFQIVILVIISGIINVSAQQQNTPSKEILEDLLSRVKGDDISASKAVKLLTKIGKPAAPALIEALSFPAGNSRDLIKGDIATALGRLRETSAIEPLKTLFYHKEESVRQDCYHALRELGWAPVTPMDKVLVFMAAGLDGNWRLDRFKIVAKCLEVGPEAIAPCTALLKHPDRDVRNRACKVLGSLKDKQVVAPLLELFVNDERSREAAGEALAALGEPSVIPLRQQLQHRDATVRRAAAMFLGKIDPKMLVGDDRTVDGFIAALKDRDEWVREKALKSLGNVKNEAAVKAICEAMQAKDYSLRVDKQHAAAALVSIGQLSVHPLINIITKCHSQSDDDLARWAASALGEIGSAEAVGSLNSLALNNWDQHGGVRSSAIRALAEIGEPGLLPIVDLTSDRRTNVRFDAVNGLRELHRRHKVSDARSIIALIARLDDDDEHVRARALAVVKVITGAETATDVFMRCIYSKVDEGRSSEAVPLVESYQEYVKENLSRVFAFASEQQKLGYMDSLRDLSHPYCMLVAVGSAGSLAGCALRLKGIVLDSLLEDCQVAAESKDPLIKEMVNQLRQAKKGGVSERELSQDSRTRQEEKRVDQLEAQLAEHFSGVSKTRRVFRVTVPKVQGVLATGVVLLEFIRYEHYLGKAKCELRYGVVLIGCRETAFKNAKPGEPVWVALGQAEAIEKNLKAYAAAMRAGHRGEETILRTLYAQLFKPVQERLPESIRTLVVCPDAELNFLNFATLVTDDNKFLAEKFILEYVASGRDLVFGSRSKKPARQLVAFANPAFSETPQLAGVHGTNSVQLAMLAADRRDYAGLCLDPLPGTEREVRFLKDSALKWKVEEKDFSGREASEAEVNALQSPYILHLATHGFFLPDAEQRDPLKPAMQALGQEHKSVVLRNPMQRSGLALAGAQITLDAWKRGETPPTENDGVLTAQEVGALNLKGTWLVVLSACDTGTGEARAGEGVLGLRRGFVQAGAQNLLMTLWPVSDKYTVEIMKEFYDRALQDGNAPLAMAEVQRQWLVRLRQEKGALMAARLAGPFVMTFQGTAEDGK